MSRGIGETQRNILTEVKAAKSPVTLETLRWSMYGEDLGRLPKLPAAWHTAFSRAVRNLEDRGLLRVEKRPLLAFDECVSHYPGKSLVVAVRELRLNLLPELFAWSKEHMGVHPKYTQAENEVFFWKQITKDKMGRLQRQWTQVDSLIAPYFAKSRSDDLLLLISKGRNFFTKLDVKTHRSFGELVESCIANEPFPPATVAALRDFARYFMEPEEVEALKLKSLVHKFASIPDQGGKCRMRDDTIEELLKRQDRYLRTLPDYPEQRKNFWDREGKYGTFLNRVFDRTVFQEFNFIEAA